MYADIRQFIDDVRGNWHAVEQRYQYARSRFFYREDFISMLLFNRTHQGLPKSTFIDYNLAFRYYSQSRKKLRLSFRGEEKTLEIPYHELINFTDEPQARIDIEKPITDYQLPEAISADTTGAFQSFLAERPNTTNELSLRVADFQTPGRGKYTASLQASGYYDEVHTALTLDYRLDHDFLATLRTQDLGHDNQLKPFGESILANHLGVFSVIALQNNGYWYFHMMPRSHKMGVFSSMLSSIGGVVTAPRQEITELVGYMTSEMKREIKEETGLDIPDLEKSGRCEIVPLAFTRELSRGGKPQFFYLTVLDGVSEKEFAKAFKKAEWKAEFRSNMFANIRALDDVLSPEFSTGLLYALIHIQKRRKIPGDTLLLP